MSFRDGLVLAFLILFFSGLAAHTIQDKTLRLTGRREYRERYKWWKGPR